MEFPGESDLLAERAALVETLSSLTDEEFDHGTTLCDEWAPRDILAHLMGTDSGLMEYVKAKGSVAAGNAAVVARDRGKSRERMMHRAEHWAAKPAPMIRASAFFFLGDTSVHHQDILRGLGRVREVPVASADAIMREGVVLGWKKLLSHRVEPTDHGRAMGRGQVVRGPAEALGMWMTGRKGIEPELEFPT